MGTFFGQNDLKMDREVWRLQKQTLIQTKSECPSRVSNMMHVELLDCI